MVSCSRRRPRRPSSLFSILDWIRILCSGCFGKMSHSKQPLSLRPPPPFLLENPDPKLSSKIANLAPYSSVREDEETSHSHIKPLAWKLTNTHRVDDDVVTFDDNDDHHADDDTYAESDDSDGMFHGLFFMGSEVLTEVELQSPVEDRKGFATPVRTPRRSNNSSHASSTRELHFGSSLVCALDSESCSSLDAMALLSPTPSQDPLPNLMNCVYSNEQRHETSIASLRSDKQYRESPHSEFTLRIASDAPLCRDKGQSSGGSLPDEDIVRFSLFKESDKILNEEKVQPSPHPSPDGKRSHTFWTDEECQGTVGSLPECMKVDVSLKQRKNSHPFTCRAAEMHVSLHDGKDQISVGSLPNCTGKSSLLVRERQKKDIGGRRARSLTDQDFTELRGCIDLGFVFTQDHIPDLRDTLPALEVCYAIAHGTISPVCNSEKSKSLSPGSPPISPWRIARPGDQPQQVKARLRHWAQAVACNVRQAR